MSIKLSPNQRTIEAMQINVSHWPLVTMTQVNRDNKEIKDLRFVKLLQLKLLKRRVLEEFKRMRKEKNQFHSLMISRKFK